MYRFRLLLVTSEADFNVAVLVDYIKQNAC